MDNGTLIYITESESSLADFKISLGEFEIFSVISDTLMCSTKPILIGTTVEIGTETDPMIYSAMKVILKQLLAFHFKDITIYLFIL